MNTEQPSPVFLSLTRTPWDGIRRDASIGLAVVGHGYTQRQSHTSFFSIFSSYVSFAHDTIVTKPAHHSLPFHT